jgi:hypothetical protein
MEAIPRKYGEWSQFDRYCKLVLYHEAIDYLRVKCRWTLFPRLIGTSSRP